MGFWSIVTNVVGCSANGGPQPTNNPLPVAVSVPPAPVVQFALTPVTVPVGQSTLATWASVGATSCSAIGNWTGPLALASSAGSSIGPIATNGTYSYGVSCSGDGGTTLATQTLTVGTVPAPYVQVQISPPSVRPGNPVTITWSSADATSCAASGGTGSDGWSGSVPTENQSGFDTGVIAAAGRYVYNLTCTGSGGVTESSLILIVAATALPSPPRIKFTALRTIIRPSEAPSLSWSTSNATACEASSGSASVAWSGVQPVSSSGVSPAPITSEGIYSFTLTCSGAGGSAAATVWVGVSATLPPLPVVIIDATPSNIATGEAAALTWSTTNASSCTGYGSWNGSKPLSGSNVSTRTATVPGVYNYLLVCAGPSGSATGIATVAVDAAAATITNFAVSAGVVSRGQSISLTWQSRRATSCTASGGSGSDQWTGVVSTASAAAPVGPLATVGSYVYTLSCSGPGGASVPRSVTVIVTSGTPTPAIISDFEAAPPTIAVGEATSLKWATSGASACTATGGTGTDGWTGDEGAFSAGASTGPIGIAGNYKYTLTCSGPGGTGQPSSVFVNVVAAAAAPATILTFTTTPSLVQAGQAASLAWTTSGASACMASGGTGSWPGSVGTSSTGTSTGPLGTPGNYTYTLTCTGAGGPGTPASVIVNVTNASPTAASVSMFTATPGSVQTGQTTVLAWTSNNAATCVAGGGTGSDGWGGAVPLSSTGVSTGPLSPAGNYTYSLTCSGPDGSAGPTLVAVTVSTPPAAAARILSFSATPSTLQAGLSTSLSWASSGATACIGSGGTGSDGWIGAQAPSSGGTSTGPIATANSYTYTLTCTGPGGDSAPISVAVNVMSAPPPAATITSFAASPTTLLPGQSSTFTWSSGTATGCGASGGSGTDNWTGALPAASSGMTIGPLNVPGIYTYTLTCTGPGGDSAPSSVTLNVSSSPAVPTINSFTASPAAVQVGGSSSLAWSSNGATSCAAGGGTGGDGWSGVQPTSSANVPVGPLSAPGTVTYTLSCTGAGGTSAVSSVSVTVTAAAPAPRVANFRATPSATQTGQSSSLSYTSTDATSCTASGGTGSDWTGIVPSLSTGTVVGPFLAAGTYTYGLLCSGDGGTSNLSTAFVTVTDAPPAATITAFTAAPTTLLTGQSTQLRWSSNAASACIAAGGTGADGWNGVRAVSSSGTIIGPLNTPGTYIYTLTCTGPGGASVPSSLSVTVGLAAPAASIVSFTATPRSITVGGSTSLAWTTLAATSCTAAQGSGSDGWGGATAPSSAGQSVGPLTAVGTLTYTLTCAGTGGSSAPSSANVTVTAVPPVPVQPTVTLLTNGGTASLIQPGASTTFSWTSSNATTCTASGGSGGDWGGVKATGSNGILVGPVNAPGVYAYTLTCSGAGGSGSATVVVTAVETNSFDCGLATPSTSSVAPSASASGLVSTGLLGLSCIGCSIDDPVNVIGPSPGTYARMVVPLGVGGYTQLRVTNAFTVPAGRKVGFVIAQEHTLLSAALLNSVTVQTLLNGTVQEVATTSGLLTLEALGLLSVNPQAGYVGFVATKPFDAAAVTSSALLTALSSLRVYEMCVSLQ
jgi:hypothetical protein